MPAKTQNVVFGIFSSILLNMSQLTENLARYSTCRYDMSSRQKTQKTHKIASNLHVLFKFLSDAVEVKGILCQFVIYHSLLSENHYP